VNPAPTGRASPGASPGDSDRRPAVYRWSMPRRKRRVPPVRPTAKPQASDQAPGEAVVQVNDRYQGGGPPPDVEPKRDAQHQTGG